MTTFAREECLTKVVSDHSLLQILSWYLLSSPIRHFRNEKVTRAEMLPAIILSIVTRDALVSYRPICFLVPSNRPQVFAKVNSAQFPLVSKVANSQKIVFSVPTVALGGATRKRARQTVYYNTSSPFLSDMFLKELLWRIC